MEIFTSKNEKLNYEKNISYIDSSQHLFDSYNNLIFSNDIRILQKLFERFKFFEIFDLFDQNLNRIGPELYNRT